MGGGCLGGAVVSFKYDLAHPYSRYGLATALLQKQIQADELNDEEIHELLAQAIETGLNHFRMETLDDPAISNILRFNYITAQRLKENRELVYTSGMNDKGLYLAPTVITNEADQQQAKLIPGTHNKSNEILNQLREGESMSKLVTMTRSFAPTTQKLNNGSASQQAPTGTLFEAACSVITTITPYKPAAKVFKSNVTIIPDLPLNELRDFIELFENMMGSNLDGNLYEAKLKKVPASQSDKKPVKRKKKNEGEGKAKAKSEYRRPRIFNGNYPFAPRQAAFGAAGLLAAIGRWGVEANQTPWAEKVLTSIAGTEERPGRPLYIVSYDDINQAQFTHHIVRLASAGELSHIIDALTFETQILSEIEGGRRFESPAYKLFYLMAGRFLQLFTRAAFRDFLATRAEYAPAIKPLFEVYFMQATKIPKDIVESARELGQWLNSTAYFVAKAEVKKTEAQTLSREDKARIQKEKAKILVEFESAAMSAKTPLDMLHRISTRAGRLLQQDAPAKATRYMDATASGEIEPQDALHLLVAYLRLRSEKTDKLETDGRADAQVGSELGASDNQSDR